MERDEAGILGVDLALDVLVRADASSYVVTDEDDFAAGVGDQLISGPEAGAARAGLVELVDIIERGDLLGWLCSIVAFGPCHPPPALDMTREPIPLRLRPGLRSTWSARAAPL